MGSQMLMPPACIQGTCDVAQNRNKWIPGPFDPTVKIRLKFHLFHDFLPSDAFINAQVAQLNDAFEDYRIEFQNEGITRDPIDRFFNFCFDAPLPYCTCPDECDRANCNSEEKAMKNFYAENPSQQINIYVVETSSTYPDPWVGAGYFHGAMAPPPTSGE
jgi:hypothetical protein